MTRKCVLLFCDNEHGVGDFTFPNIAIMTAEEIQQVLIQSRPLSALRRDAKAAGWGRINGGDYCPACMEGMSQ